MRQALPNIKSVLALSAISVLLSCQKLRLQIKTPVTPKSAKLWTKRQTAILSSLRKGEYLAALCVEGKQFSSEELAKLIADRANSGAGDIAFVIGSSHGLADSVKKAANAKLSMGRITMPHQLARLVLTEQIYRACTINNGMKYHK